MAIGIVTDEESVPNAIGQQNPMPVGKDYTVAVDYSGGTNPIYVGEALPGTLTASANWRIKKIAWDANNNPTSVAWASGTKGFNKVWNDRASYTYS